MNDAELDQLIAAAATVSDAEVMAWDLAAPEAHLREEIMSTTSEPVPGASPAAGAETAPTATPAGVAALPDADAAGPTVIDLTRAGRDTGSGSLRPRRRRILPLVAAAAVVVTAVGAVTLATERPANEQVADVASDQGGGLGPAAAGEDPAANGPGATPATAEDVATAAALPTIAPGGTDWAITYFDAPTAEQGDMSISAVGPAAGDDPARLDLWWAPASFHDEWVAAAEDAGGPGTAATVAGQPATVVAYGSTTTPTSTDGNAAPGNDPAGEMAVATGRNPADGPYFAAFLVVDAHAVSVSGVFPSRQDFDAALATLEHLPAEAWVARVPAVLPSQRPAAVDAMLADIPTPPGFDVEAVRAPAPAVRGPYHVGADVTGAVACGWIDAWVTARESGDAATVQAAVDAMASSHEWDVLVDMADDGDWPEVLWEYADALATDGPVSGGRPLTVTESYTEALGC